MLFDDVTTGPWSQEEIDIVVQAHNELGNKWSEIAKRLDRRTENGVKNLWNSYRRRGPSALVARAALSTSPTSQPRSSSPKAHTRRFSDATLSDSDSSSSSISSKRSPSRASVSQATSATSFADHSTEPRHAAGVSKVSLPAATASNPEIVAARSSITPDGTHSAPDASSMAKHVRITFHNSGLHSS